MPLSELSHYRDSPGSMASGSADSPGGAYSTDGSHHGMSHDMNENLLTKVQSAPAKSCLPPPKTDKPRPHVCITCSRSFARLEHLKRHERSHTKEKPFECPQCTRCFARRDLLLRHQQKLHLTPNPASSKPGRRRESASGSTASGGRARKGSSASIAQQASAAVAAVAAGGASGSPRASLVNGANARPRANTISHLDAGLGILNGMQQGQQLRLDGNGEPLDYAHHYDQFDRSQQQHQQQQHSDVPANFDPRRAMAQAHQRSSMHSLPRLSTHRSSISSDMHTRTAPPVGGHEGGGLPFSPGMHQLNGSTIDPSQLLTGDELDPSGAFHMDVAMMEEDENFDWLPNFASPNMHNFQPPFDPAIGSSPSMMSNGSMAGLDFTMGGTGEQQQQQQQQGAMHGLWQNGLQRIPSGQSHYSMDSGFNNGMSRDANMQMDQPHHQQLHQQHHQHPQHQLHHQHHQQQHPQHAFLPSNAESFYPSPPHVPSHSPQGMHNHMNGNANGNGGGYPQHMPQSMKMGVHASDGASVASSGVSNGGSARRSSVTTQSTDTITEATRQTLLASLQQAHTFGSSSLRKYSQPSVSSPLREAAAKGFGDKLPSVQDLQRYVGAYIHLFHPHFPFLHIPTLSFDTPTFTSSIRPSMGSISPFPSAHGIVGGGGCLILAMAAIGALYEQERVPAKELFDYSKKTIQLYLEERRKADASGKMSPGEGSANRTPLWLVQAMLLNVIYGHNCGDKVSGDIASTHCAALISLARGANLMAPLPEGSFQPHTYLSSHRLSTVHEAGEGVHFSNPFDGNNAVGASPEDTARWHEWVHDEERKRTLYAIFHMSSMLVMAYNHAPALMNSEIHLDLPCDEDMWCAETAAAWTAKGGMAATQRVLPFNTALHILLTASQAQGHAVKLTPQQPFGSGMALNDLPPSALKPSTFGCLILINALHNYIWETRQRHSGSQWSLQETESMHAHIEPALRAWQSAWASNPLHSLERPNPYGMGPLSADCIPLLDLAYVRLFVNLGTSKEAFWQRDFDGMSAEFELGTEIVQHADLSEVSTDAPNTAHQSRNSPELDAVERGGSGVASLHSRASKRERHLRKAAFYAADSLSMSDKLGVSFADFTGRELPLQAGLCTLDCAQILAEWVSTVQERIGPHLGLLGRDRIDYSAVEAIMLLEDEDCKLLEKIADILHRTEAKLVYEVNNHAANSDVTAFNRMPALHHQFFGSKMLNLTGYMFERAAVWPVTKVMAEGVRIQAVHIQRRAEESTKSRVPPQNHS